MPVFAPLQDCGHFGAFLVADPSASGYSCEVLAIYAFLYTKTFLLADKSATENILRRHHRKCYMDYTYVGIVRLTFLAKLIIFFSSVSRK